MKKYSLTTKENSRRTSRKRRLVEIGILFLILIAGFYTVPKIFGTVSATVLAPIVSVESWLRESGATIPAFLRDREYLLGQIERRDTQLIEHSGSALTISRLQQENESLRQLLNASSSTRIAAGVVKRPPATPYDVLVLDQGSEAGIVPGAPVFTGGDQVIGYVSDVYQETAVVVLASAPGAESTVYILGPNIYTTAVGVGGGVLRVGVPQGIPLAQGDLVVIPSFDSGVYGEIATVDTLETRPEQYGFVTTEIPIQSLRFVSVGAESLTEISFAEARAVVERVNNELTTVPVPTGVLVELPNEQASSTATSTNASTSPAQ